MQRGLISRPPRAHRGADEQREDADTREDVVEQAGAAWQGRQLHVRDFARTEPQQRVGVAIAGLELLLHGEDVGAAFDRLTVDGEQDVARADAGAARRRTARDFRRDDAHGALDPQHAVFDFVRRRPRDDVGEPERQQAQA